MADLLSNFTLKNKAVSNRLVFPPVVRFGLSNEDGLVTKKNIDHYDFMASGKMGIVIVEATCISPRGRLSFDQLGLWNDDFIPGMAKIAEAIHGHGGLALIQIHHAGIKTDPRSTSPENIVAPSPYVLDGRQIREISEAEIDSTIEEFAQAALRAQKAGFDGVELHGAHGYLISQFLSPETNNRTDAYGESKTLFGEKVIQATKAAVQENFIVGIRLGANDPDLQSGIAHAKAFEKAGVDFLNISSGFNTKMPEDAAESNFTWICQLGLEVKKHVSVPVMCVNGIANPKMADEVIKAGADFACAARGLLSDPFWIDKFVNNQDTNPCARCRSCFFRTTSKCPARIKSGLIDG